MLLTIQFPFADLRKFIKDTNRLNTPDWFFPKPDMDFIHFFGAIRYRKRGGAFGWVGEGKICESNRAFRFCENLFLADNDVNLNVGLECAYRRYYFDGQAVGKFEVGISPTKPWLNLTQAQTKKLLTYFLQIPVRIPQSSAEMKYCDLVRASKPLSQLYARATTAVPDNGRRQFENWWVTPGPPLLFLEYNQGEKIAPSRHAKWVPLPAKYSLKLFFDRFSYPGGTIPMWVLGINDQSNFDMARTLRLYLLRLHAEHVCLGLVLSSLLNGKPVVEEHSPESQRLQRYMNKATKRIRWHESRSREKFDRDISEVARESMNLVNPGDYERLVEMLDAFAPRPAVIDNVKDYLGGPEKARLRQILVEMFNEGELIDLAFELGVDYDSLPALGKGNKARELIMYLDRRRRLPELKLHIEILRPSSTQSS